MTEIKRKNFTPLTTEKIFDACRGECFYCHKELSKANRFKGQRGAWNADHLYPASKGGENSLQNGVAACWNCNSKKSDMTHSEFITVYGGTLYRVDAKIRCHGFTRDGFRCSLFVTDTKKFCTLHGSEPQTNLMSSFGNLKISSDTTQKHRNFVQEPMENKSVTALAGIGDTLGKRLSRLGYDKAYSVLGQFLQLQKNEEKFVNWMKTKAGANSKQALDCFHCLSEWCDNFL